MKPKNIVITGCSTGIGLATAILLKAHGHHVFATARNTNDLTTLKQAGLQAHRLDVDDSQSINNFVKQLPNTIDVLVNNAGFGQPGALEDLSRDLLRAQFETNVFGLQELTNAIIPIMRKQGRGRIINVSSILGLISMTYRGAYNASKYAVEGLSDTLRLELKDIPIHVCLIEPGPIKSEFRHTAVEKFTKAQLLDKNSPHHERYKQMKAAREKKPDPFALPPEAVAKKILHAVESKKPKIRYKVTLPSQLLSLLKRALPDRALDYLLTIICNKELKT